MILSLCAFIRIIVGWLDLVIVTSILYTLSWLPKKWTENYLQKLYQYWCKTLVRALRVDLKLHQNNKYDLPTQFILIGNHPSVFEDVGVPSLFPYVHFLAKHEVRNWWFVGKISQAVGTFYVQRESKPDRERSRIELTQALKAGCSIGLYPEGGCKGRRIHLPFKYGVFDLSIQSGVPIVPLFLYYESQADFEWENQHILHKIWTIMCSQNRTAHYYVYDAISPSEFKSKEQFCDHMQNRYLEWQKQYLE
jgi:1-acyl-sn-glycerol-3-phosphate acyltransferase